MTIKELKEQLEDYDEDLIICIRYSCGNGNVYSEVSDVIWEADVDYENNGIIAII